MTPDERTTLKFAVDARRRVLVADERRRARVIECVECGCSLETFSFGCVHCQDRARQIVARGSERGSVSIPEARAFAEENRRYVIERAAKGRQGKALVSFGPCITV